jgi:NAD+ diphosphatase
MDDMAIFVQGDCLLLPADVKETQAVKGISRELAKDFENPDIFSVPPIDGSLETINTVSVLPGTALPAEWRSVPVRQLIGILPRAARLLRACHLAQWRKDSRFCGTCGAENVDGAPEPHRRCPKCGRLEFPRICPAVIVLITDAEDKILLAHNKKFRQGMYSLIAGFNEAGESLEETVVREIREEVNIEVKDIGYVKSQSWPFPNSLMLGFKARHLSGAIKPDGDEIEDVNWFARDNLPELPGHGSLSRYLIERWINNKEF